MLDEPVEEGLISRCGRRVLVEVGAEFMHRGLPAEDINGMAIYRNAETSTDQWDAIVEGAAR